MTASFGRTSARCSSGPLAITTGRCSSPPHYRSPSRNDRSAEAVARLKASRSASLRWFVGPREDLRAVRQSNVRRVRELLPVLRGKSFDLDDRAELHRALFPAATQQRAGRSHLNRPVHDLAVGTLHIDVD